MCMPPKFIFRIHLFITDLNSPQEQIRRRGECRPCFLLVSLKLQHKWSEICKWVITSWIIISLRYLITYRKRASKMFGFFDPPPLSLSQMSWFCSFRLLFVDPLPPPTADVIYGSLFHECMKPLSTRHLDLTSIQLGKLWSVCIFFAGTWRACSFSTIFAALNESLFLWYCIKSRTRLYLYGLYYMMHLYDLYFFVRFAALYGLNNLQSSLWARNCIKIGPVPNIECTIAY